MFEIVTLTGFPDIFKQFQISCDYREPDVKRVVVTSRGVEPYIYFPERWRVVKGIDPFVFARNANLGILAAGKNDVVLTNDDVQFTRTDALKDLHKAAYTSSDIGIMSPVFIGTVGNRLQRVDCAGRWEGTTYSEERLAFVCVYIKRSVIDVVGLLDEQFDGYGGDDDDYCMRVQQAGYRLAVTTTVVVRHGYGNHNSSSSFARTMGHTGESMSQMRQKLLTKHGAMK